MWKLFQTDTVNSCHNEGKKLVKMGLRKPEDSLSVQIEIAIEIA